MSTEDLAVPHFQQPTFQEVRSIIETIDAMTHGHSDIDAVKEQVRLLMSGYRMTLPSYPCGLRLFRARVVSSRPQYLTEIGAPPADVVRTQQRCNRVGEPMFYCSASINVPLHEIQVQSGQEVIISEWKTTADLIVNHVGYTSDLFASFGATRALPNFGLEGQPTVKVNDSAIARAIEAYEPDLAVLREVSNYLAQIFAARIEPGNEHLYSPSIAVTEILLTGDENIVLGPHQGFGGLQYPTMQMNADGDNFALKLSFANRYLQFVAAHHIRVTGLNKSRSYMSSIGLNTAHEATQEGRLIWGHRCGFFLPPDLTPVRGTWEYLFPRK